MNIAKLTSGTLNLKKNNLYPMSKIKDSKVAFNEAEKINTRWRVTAENSELMDLIASAHFNTYNARVSKEVLINFMIETYGHKVLKQLSNNKITK
jgi:hypothetical protein